MYTKLSELPYTLDEVIKHLKGDILVVSHLTHRLWVAPHVHEYIGYLEVCYGAVHVLVQASSRDVIDDCSTILLHSEAGNLGSEGINRYGEFGVFVP